MGVSHGKRGTLPLRDWDGAARARPLQQGEGVRLCYHVAMTRMRNDGAGHLRPMRERRCCARCAASFADLPDDIVARVEVTPARDPSHGDMATNAALVAAKAARQPPAKLAAAIVEHLQQATGVARASAAGPRLRQSDAGCARCFAPCCRTSCAPAMLTATAPSATARGSTSSTSPPTPPARCISAIAAAPWWATRWPTCSRKAGYDVTKEYYINDAGAQVTALAWAAYWRYLQAIGTPLSEADFSDEVPGGLQYRGDYLIPIGERLAATIRHIACATGWRHRRAGSLARHRARLHHRGDDAGRSARTCTCSASNRTCSARNAR